MTPWAYMAVHSIAGFGSMVYLIQTGHPVWAGFCLFLIAATSITELNTQRGARHG